MKVVLDTNVLISCCWKPGGNEARVVRLALTEALCVCVSEFIVAEYREVAARKKFAAHRECLETTIAAIVASAEMHTPPQACLACSDADDNRLLDCAAAAGAEFVITGNLRHFPAEWNNVRVCNARQFLEHLGLATT
jgi:putative PIN family toxin of toxin-antitoxin system